MSATQVVLITQPTCDLCDQALAVLDRLSAEFDLAVRTVSLATPEGEELARQGEIMFPPGLFIDDEPFSFGRVSEWKLRRELDRRASKPHS